MVEEAGVPGDNHRPWASNWQTVSLAAARRVHPFCNLQSRARTHAVLVIGLYELLDPATYLIEPPGPMIEIVSLITNIRVRDINNMVLPSPPPPNCESNFLLCWIIVSWIFSSTPSICQSKFRKKNEIDNNNKKKLGGKVRAKFYGYVG